MIHRHLFCSIVSLLFLFASHASAESKFPPSDARRILFLGDSITFAGHYVAMIETQLRLASPRHEYEIVNLGLPSETCTGLSEPDHPFPRPNVHERLERALAKFRPDVVVACYGMNDGIYYPFDEKRFAAYRQGINRLIEKVNSTGAELVLMTPPPFDPLPLRKKGALRPAASEKFAWFAIYEGYDDVMTRYAAWLMKQGERVEQVIDLHTPVAEFLSERRRSDPEFTMSPDGVHLNREGHVVLSETILAAWGHDSQFAEAEDLLKLVEQREVMLRDAWLSHVGHKRPGVKEGLPLDVAKLQAAELQKQIAHHTSEVVPHRLVVQGNGKLAIVDSAGEIEWEMPWGGIHDIHVLDNGHIMVQERDRKVVEIDPETKQIVWSYDLTKRNGNAGKRVEVHAFQPLKNGNVMIAESGAGRIIEVTRNGKVVKEIPLSTAQEITVAGIADFE